MLHCFKRFTKAAGSSWKEGHIGNSGVGKRVVSTLIVFLMVFSLVQGFNSNVMAAAGINTLNYEVLSDGRIHIYGTGTAVKSGVGGSNTIYPGSHGLYYYGADGRIGYCSDVTRSFTWHSSAYTTYDYHYYARVPLAQKYYFYFRILDNTSGLSSTYAQWVGSATNMINMPIADPTPAAPTISSNTITPGDGYINISVWTGHTNGAPLVSYIFRYSTDGGSTYKDYVMTYKECANATATISGLTNGVEVKYYLVSTNTYGTSTVGPYTITPGTATAPTNLRTEPVNGGYTIMWDPPADLRGGTVQNYYIWYLQNTYVSPKYTTAATARSYTITGLPNAVYTSMYYSAIAAKTQYGVGVPANVPYVWIGAPQSVKAPTVTKSSTERKLTVSWTAPANNGSAITRYDVYAGSTNIGYTTGATSGTFTWPADNTNYNISVVATNANGTGPNYYSSPVKTNGVPAAPTLSSVAATGTDIMTTKSQGKFEVFLGI